MAVAAVTLGAAGAVAQIPLPPSTTSTTAPPTTTTTQPAVEPPTTTTTTAPPPAPEPTAPPASNPPGTGGDPPASQPGSSTAAEGPAPATPGTDPAAPAPAPGAPGAPGPAAGAPARPAGGPAAPGPPPAPGEVPPEAQRAMQSVRRSGPNSTRRLLAALAPLLGLGMTQEEVVAAGFGRFPVGGVATFTHDWLYPRFTPEFHLHQGTDLFAATGVPVRAPADGVLKLAQGGAGGLAAYVYQPDGTYYYMAHLHSFVKGQRNGQAVRVGEVVGYVGDSGNAKGGAPHVHFEIHPAPTRAVVSGTGRSRTVTHVTRPVPVGTVLPAVDPKATLDQWLAEALAAAPQLVAARLAERAAAPAVAGATLDRLAALSARAARSQLLWASSVGPAGNVRLAEAEAVLAASEFDWAASAERYQARLAEQAAALAWSQAVLAPLTPDSLLPTAADE
ncbi:MAG: M23 family metallopeptidase [Actinomycetota bacterium]